MQPPTEIFSTLDGRRDRARARAPMLAWALAFMVAALIVLGFRAEAANAAVPSNPSANSELSDATQTACQADAASTTCIDDVTTDIDKARAAEGVGPISLPADFGSLTVPQQLLTISNLERIDRGEPAIEGLSTYLNSDATTAAAADEDPMMSAGDPGYGMVSWTANWSGGSPSPLEADFEWMYDDGYGSGNEDCTSATAPGCWGHRDDILATGSQPILMGAADDPTSLDGVSMTELFVFGDTELSPDATTWATIAATIPVGISTDSVITTGGTGSIELWASGEAMDVTASVPPASGWSVSPSSCNLAAGETCELQLTAASGAEPSTLTVTGPNGAETVSLQQQPSSGYAGTVSNALQTADLAGSGSVVITTSGGLLLHNNLGSGFASDADFDSAEAGVQSVPDTGGWTVNVTGSGSDSLEIDEGESTSPVSYAAGHTYYPGGTPCIVRDPNDRGGIVAFSVHPSQEADFCYPGGIGSVTVRAGTGVTEDSVLDTAPGVPIHFYGGPGDSTFAESLDVPTSVGGFHEPMSPVYYTSGSAESDIALIDGSGTSPATYTIGNGEIDKAGLPPLYFDGTPAEVDLYPQPGPSNITIGPTGGFDVQIFGNFFGQTGPDTINAGGADSPVFITGSLGNDTITGSPAGGFVYDGGGNDTITVGGTVPQVIQCSPGSDDTISASSVDILQGCPPQKTGGGTSTTPVATSTTPLATSTTPVGTSTTGVGGASTTPGGTSSEPAATKPSLHGLKFSVKSVKSGAKASLEIPAKVSGTLKLSFDLATEAKCKTKSKRLTGSAKSAAKSKLCVTYVSEGEQTITLKSASDRTQTKVITAKTKVRGKTRDLPKGTYRVVAQLSEHGRSSTPLDLTLKVS